MIALGMGLVWAGYGFGVWGYALIKGYDLGVADIWSPTRYYDTSSWPPPKAPADQIIPKGSGRAPAASVVTVSAPAGGQPPKLAPGRKRT